MYSLQQYGMIWCRSFVVLYPFQEVKSLVSNSDGISGCVFLKEGLLGSTSYDGQIEVWDVQSGCR